VLGLAAGPTVALLAVPAPAAVAGTSSERYERGSLLCSVRDERLAESSGLVVLPDGRLVTVNDGTSGDLFYLDRACRVSEVVPTGVSGARDVEDLARGPDGSLWLADVGDNAGERATVALFRVPPSGSPVQRFALRYPDGPQDAEALIVDSSGRPFVVTKNALGTSSVLAPAGALSPTAVTPLREVATVALTPPRPGSLTALGRQVAVTGAALSPDGRLLVLRTYTDAYEWQVPSGDIPAALRGEPIRIPLPESPQGEAIAYSPQGDTLLTTSEKVPALVHELRRAPAGAAPRAPADPSTGLPSSSAALPPGASPSPADDPAGTGPPTSLSAAAAIGVLVLTALAAAGVAGRRALALRGRRR